MTVNLTSTTDYFEFEGAPNTVRPIATSGEVGAGTIKLQHRVDSGDDWVDNPNLDTGDHLSGILTLVARYNRVYVDGADGDTDVNLEV